MAHNLIQAHQHQETKMGMFRERISKAYLSYYGERAIPPGLKDVV